MLIILICIINDQINSHLQPILYDTTLAVCDLTIRIIYSSLLKDYPTLELWAICSSPVFAI